MSSPPQAGPASPGLTFTLRLPSSNIMVQVVGFAVLLVINVAILWKASELGQWGAAPGPTDKCVAMCREAHDKGLSANSSQALVFGAAQLFQQESEGESSRDITTCAPCAPCAPCPSQPCETAPGASADGEHGAGTKGGRWADDPPPPSDGVDVIYAGEFGFEALFALPLAYWHYLNGSLRSTGTCDDLGLLYYFSKNHTDNVCTRSLRANEEQLPMFGMSKGYHDSPLPKLWHPPPFKAHFQERPRLLKQVVSGDPFVVICNKYENYGGKLTNTIPVPTVVKMIELFLQAGYFVVYNRPFDLIKEDSWQVPLMKDVSGSGKFVGDFEAIADKFSATGKVKTTHELSKEFNHITFNEMQLRLYARSNCFISVQGGNSALTSYWGGRNIIYVTASGEVPNKVYERIHPKLSGAEIVVTETTDALEKEVAKMIELGRCGVI